MKNRVFLVWADIRQRPHSYEMRYYRFKLCRVFSTKTKAKKWIAPRSKRWTRYRIQPVYLNSALESK